MTVARGVADRDIWLDAIAFGLRQLAAFETGEVALKGNDLSISGKAADPDGFKSAQRALARDLPKGLRLAKRDIAAPVAKPYTWSARLGENQLEFSGFTPSEAARDDIFSRAKLAFPKFAIVDRTQTAAGAPADWRNAAAIGLELLTSLKDGAIELTDTAMALSGTAAGAETADALRRLLRERMPASFKVADTIALAAPIVTGTTATEPAEAAAPDAEAGKAAVAEATAPSTPQRETAASPAPQPEGNAGPKTEARSQTQSEAPPVKVPEREVAVARVPETQLQKEAARCQERLSDSAAKGVIEFARASADLEPKSRPTLDRLAEIVKECPSARIEIAGHTDSEGEPERNQNLSRRRAQAVTTYLTGTGVGADRLNAIGYGDLRPIAPNDTPENRARNRRIEFTVRSD
jgi:outer membrane protein OmpA-like peptidoglycan-associated protein